MPLSTNSGLQRAPLFGGRWWRILRLRLLAEKPKNLLHPVLLLLLLLLRLLGLISLLPQQVSQNARCRTSGIIKVWY